MYLFIAYRPNGVDIRMGCRVGYSGSDFIAISQLDRAALMRAWAEILQSNKESSEEYEAYQVQIYEGDYRCWDEVSDNGYTSATHVDPFGAEIQIEHPEIEKIREDAERLSSELIMGRKLQEQEAQRAKEEAAERQKTELRRREYEKLKAEFDGV